MNSLVSICIPTFNGEKFLQEALDSVKRQTYKNMEVIISDDASKDITLELCEKFKKEVSFPVFIFHHKPNGIGANWNNCIKNANGIYIKFLFQDDVLEADCLEQQIQFLEENNLKAVCSARTIIDENGFEINTGGWFDAFGNLHKTLNFQNGVFIFDKKFLKTRKYITYNYFGEPDTFLYHKELFKEIGFFREDLRQILDLELSYRILLKNNIGIQRQKLMQFRVHENQASSKNAFNEINENQILEKEVLPFFLKYWDRSIQKSYLLKRFPLMRFLRISKK